MIENKFDNRLFFRGQMNLDTSPELVENGFYGKGYNIRPYNPETGSVGTITQENGNAIVSYTFSGVNAGGFVRCVGSKLDLKRNGVYWLVYGQNNGSDQYAYVLYYSYETDDITTVYSGINALELTSTAQVDNIDIIYDDEIGDTLFWTDTTTEPKELNVTAGINRFNNYTDKITSFLVGEIAFADSINGSENVFLYIPVRCRVATNTFPSYNYATGLLNSASWTIINPNECYTPFLIPSLFYRKPTTPYFSPNATFVYETGTPDNTGAAANLRRKSYQFRYQYVYAWGQVSEWSPISEAVFSQEITSGIFANGITSVNGFYPVPKSVKVKIPISVLRAAGTSVDDVNFFPHAMISGVNVALREVSNALAPGDWYKWDAIPFEELYKYSVDATQISAGFPVLDSPGTYFYNWDTFGFHQNAEISRVIHITAEYDGSQTLIPVDIAETSENYFRVGKRVKTQTIVDNRIIDGGVTDGINVTKAVADSWNNNIQVTPRAFDVNISVDPQLTAINNWTPAATFTSITVNDTVATVRFDLTGALGNYNQYFQYGFTVNFTIVWRLFPLGQPITSIFTAFVSGQSQGIPTEFASFEAFLENAISDAFADFMNPANAIRITSIAVNNATGQLTFIVTINASFSPTAIINSVLFATIPTQTFQIFTGDGYLPERTWKNHSTQQIGVAFSDETGRLSQIVTSDWGAADIGHFIDNDLSPVKFKLQVSNLANVIVPEDARVAHIVRKISPSYSNFIQCCLSQQNTVEESWNYDRSYAIGFVNLEVDEPQVGILSNTAKLYLTLNAANGGDGFAYESVFRTQILDFNPQQGDVLRFLYRMNSSGVIVQRYDSTFNVIDYNSQWNTVVIDYDDVVKNEPSLATFLVDNEPSAGQFRILFEIIKKPTVSEQELYWEIAAQLSCSNGVIDVNPDRDSLFLYGDTYLKLRGYCVDYILTGNSPNTSIFQNFILQDKSYSDFFTSANTGIGRPNQYAPNFTRGGKIYSETERDNIIRYSENSIQNTNVRRYATVYSANLAEQDNIFGRIELLDGEGDKLNIFQEDKTSYRFVGRGIVTELDGSQRAIATQSQVLSEPMYSPFSGGISQDSASFAKSGYRSYFTDRKRGMVYRNSMDGLTPISEVGMSGEFKKIFRDIRNSFTTPIIRGIVDGRVDEYILSLTYSKVVQAVVTSASFINFTLSKPSGGVLYNAFADDDIILIDPLSVGKYKPQPFIVLGNEFEGSITVSQKPGGPNPPQIGSIIRVEYPVNVTLIYSERTGGWTTYLSYTAEWLSSGIQSYSTFFNGQMYLHDIGNTNYNTFHGIEQDSYVDVISNVDPTQTKYFLTMGADTNSSTISVGEGGVTTSLDQVSFIPNADFKNREGTMWAAFYGNGTGTQVLNGDRLMGRWLKARINFGATEINEELLKLFSVTFNSKNSGFSV